MNIYERLYLSVNIIFLFVYLFIQTNWRHYLRVKIYLMKVKTIHNLIINV